MKTKLLAVILAAGLLLPAGCRAQPKRSSFDIPERNGQQTSSNQTSADGDSIPTRTPSYQCTAEEPHPMGESIAGRFEVSYQQVMTWYCGGDSFSDILLALETGKLVEGVQAGDLLRRLDEQTWEQIWDDLDVSLP